MRIESTHCPIYFAASCKMGVSVRFDISRPYNTARIKPFGMNKESLQIATPIFRFSHGSRLSHYSTVGKRGLISLGYALFDLVFSHACALQVAAKLSLT